LINTSAKFNIDLIKATSDQKLKESQPYILAHDAKTTLINQGRIIAMCAKNLLTAKRLTNAHQYSKPSYYYTQMPLIKYSEHFVKSQREVFMIKN
jgi:hypothetical protein